MTLSTLDHVLIFGILGIVLAIGLGSARSSGKDTGEFFLSGRRMPWWLLGFSMVATTFSTDTPNLVTDIVRQNGVAGNWAWWAFLLTGLLTVFVYARLWRISGVSTDMEFYSLRYGGRPAAFLRWFRALYLGVLFNVFAMAGVTLAAIKIGQVMLGLEPWVTVAIAGSITVVFSALGGFKGVVLTDFVLFGVAMFGSVAAAAFLVNLPEVGGLEALIAHPEVEGKLGFTPAGSDTEAWVLLFVIPLAVQWWSAWYPGGEPGGGGYIAQRMLAAKNDHHAVGATFFFNIMHYAVRPWPWILVALASLVVYPDLQALQEAFPGVTADKLGDDLAYSAMLTRLPSGLLGLVLASLGAAYMSTMSSHLNWGASYVVNDFYRTQVNPEASDRELVRVGRWATVGLMVISALMALQMKNAKQLFDLIILFGAGTGPIFILRWFWWRINAWSEISAMFASGFISILFNATALGTWLFTGPDAEGIMPSWAKFPMVVLLTSLVWLVVTFLTPAEDRDTLERFRATIKPGGPGWRKIAKQDDGGSGDGSPATWSVPTGIAAMLTGCILVYGCLFAIGRLLYGDYLGSLGLFLLASGAAVVLRRLWRRLSVMD